MKLVKFLDGEALGERYYGKAPPAGTVGILRPYSQKRGWMLMSHEEGTPKSFYLTSGAVFEDPTPDEQKAFEPAAYAHMPRTSGGYTGTDPEVFVVDKQGVLIPAWSFLPSKKDAPHRNLSPAPFWDGFQAEYTTKAGGCHAYHVDDIQRGLLRVRELARQKQADARLTWQSVLPIPSKVMAEADPAHLELGCAPSLNAYGTQAPMLGEEPQNIPIRFAGFHVHLSPPSGINGRAEAIIRTIDAIAGVASVALFRDMDDPERRQYYGLAGEYRLPPHGIEYRTLSSSVLCHPAVTHFCLDLTRCAGGIGKDEFGWLWKADPDAVQQTINTCDVDHALAILKENDAMMTAIIEKLYGRGHTAAQRLLKDGAKKCLDVGAMETNWRIDGTWIEHSGEQNCCMAALSI